MVALRGGDGLPATASFVRRQRHRRSAARRAFIDGTMLKAVVGFKGACTRDIGISTDSPALFSQRFEEQEEVYIETTDESVASSQVAFELDKQDDNVDIGCGSCDLKEDEDPADAKPGGAGHFSQVPADAVSSGVGHLFVPANAEVGGVGSGAHVTADAVSSGVELLLGERESVQDGHCNGENSTVDEEEEQESVASSELECERNGMRLTRTESSNKVYTSLLSVIDKVDYENIRQALLNEIFMDAVVKGLAARTTGELKKIAALDWESVSPSLVLMLGPFPELARNATQMPMGARGSAIADAQAQIVKMTEYLPRLVPD